MSARRLPSALAVGIVVAIGVAALVDGLRSGDPVPATATESEPGPEPDLARHAAALREAGALGLLVVRRPDCGVELLAMPDLARTSLELCAELDASGHVVSLDGRLPSPADNVHVASCVEEGVLVERGDLTFQLPGCAPAWRPDGMLSVVSAGELWGVRLPDTRPRRLLSREELGRLFDPGLPPGDRRSLEVREVVWSSDTHLVTILRRDSEPRYLVATLSPTEVLRWHCCFEDLRRLRLSPGGTFVDVASEEGALVYRTTGEPFPLGLQGGRPVEAVAWSPADRFVAVARAGSVTIFEPDGSGLAPIARLPIEAADLRWALAEREVLLPEGTN